MSDLVKVESQASHAPALFDMNPREKVAHVTEMANVLTDIIEKQKLFSVIQGKKHVRVDGWICLGTLLGILPREKSVEELPDGSFNAHVELVRFDTGKVVAGASSLCHVSEKRWSTAEKYARRSMAVTRATGKAYRLAFSWIMGMAGYEPTPAEEMDGVEKAAGGGEKVVKQELAEKKPEVKVKYDKRNKMHQDALVQKLEERNLPSSVWDDIGEALHGKFTTQLDEVIKTVVQ